MADAQDLGSCGLTRGSSNLPARTSRIHNPIYIGCVFINYNYFNMGLDDVLPIFWALVFL